MDRINREKMNAYLKFIAKILIFCNKLIYRFYCKMLRIRNVMKFASCGKNLVFNPENSDFIYSHIFIGEDVHIGPRACFMSSIANIYIGNKVVFGPNVTIRGGEIIFLTYLASLSMILLIMTKGQETIPM